MKILVASLILTWGGLSVCRTSAVEDSAGTGERVLATVNGDPILETEFQAYLEMMRGELAEDPSPVPTRELFRDYVTTRLLVQEAGREGVTVGESQVQHYLQSWVPGGLTVTREFSDQIYEYLVAQQLLKQKILPSVEISLREVQSYYEQHADRFEVDDQAQVLEILTPTREEALELRSKLSDGDFSRFRELARSHSVGVTADKGGDLGSFQRGELPEEFDRVIFALNPGEISQPFQSGHGFHLFVVEEWVPRHMQKFHEVREEIFRMLLIERERMAVESYIEDLFKQSRIEVFDSSLVLEEVETDDTRS
jgi:hypothetical protein